MEVKIKNADGSYSAAEVTIENNTMIVSPKGEKFESKDEKFEPKDGDVISCGWNTGLRSYSWISILKGEIERITDNLFISEYCSINCDGTLSLENGYSDSATYVRYATEEERKKLFDKIEAEGYEWLPEEKKLVKKTWRPWTGENYWTFYFNCGSGFVPTLSRWDSDGIDATRYKKGWAFKTKEECQQFCDKLNKAIEGVKP